MFVVTAIVTALLAAMLLYSASAKLTRQAPMVESVRRVGFPEERLAHLALVLLAGAAGLVLGLWWAPIGVAAAIGVVAYFAVTITYHVRADDPENIPRPLVIGLLAVAALVLRLVTWS